MPAGFTMAPMRSVRRVGRNGESGRTSRQPDGCLRAEERARMHTYTISSANEGNVWKWWAVCSCGWNSLKYHSAYYATLSGDLHVGDYNN